MIVIKACFKGASAAQSQSFQIVLKSESHKWELPGEMVDHCCEKAIWVFYSWKEYRREISHTAAHPLERQRCKKIGLVLDQGIAMEKIQQ